MPTYRNTGTVSLIINGVRVDPDNVAHSNDVVTTKILSHSSITQVDPAPYWNPLTAVHEPTAGSAGDQTVTLSSPMTCKKVRIQKISASINITVYLRSKMANSVPVLKSWTSTDPIIDIPVEGKVDTIVITFSGAGSCQVLEFKE